MAKSLVPHLFSNAQPTPVLAEVRRLECEGYRVFKEWGNGIEMRKESEVSGAGVFFRLLLIAFLPLVGIPFFGRGVLARIAGYEVRAFVANAAGEPEVFIV